MRSTSTISARPHQRRHVRRLPALRTMHVGDIFAWKALPYIDAGNGGSVMQQPKTLAKAVATVKNVDTIINGHIPVSTWNDLKDTRSSRRNSPPSPRRR